VLTGEPDQSEKIAQYFYERIRNLIMSKSFTLTDKGVKMLDIVRDVLRYVPLHWTATEVV
jgi:linoleate 10R-lipoxygenase